MGTCHVFMVSQPLQGWRHVKVTDRRTAPDFAYGMRELVDVHFPNAAVMSVVLDNLHTPKPAALYEAFPPATARRLLRRLACRDTPTHGSWLNAGEGGAYAHPHNRVRQSAPTVETATPAFAA